MHWRFISVLIVLFWVVMTGLLVRNTYFPDESSFAEVPPRQVFDLFLNEAATFNNTLHLYRGAEKRGHTNFSIRKDEQGDAEGDMFYDLLATGSITLDTQDGKSVDAAFRLNARLLNAETWTAVELEITANALATAAFVVWKQGDKIPSIKITKDNQVVMDSSMLAAMLPGGGGALGGLNLGGGIPLLAHLPALATAQKTAAGKDGAPGPALKAREGVMDLAGKRRKCYIVTLSIMQGTEVRAFFSEVGELARVELPQDYRFIEPMMHGLEPGLNTINDN